MGLLTANHYESILQFALGLSECESRSALTHTIAVSLNKHFDFKVRAKFTRKPGGTVIRSGDCDHPFQSAKLRRMSGACCQIDVESIHGDSLRIEVENKASTFDRKGIELLNESLIHIEAAFKQACRVETLKDKMAKLRWKQRAEPSAGTVGRKTLLLAQLTPREKEAVEFLGEGLSNNSIAEKMNISRRTVEKHLESVYAKLGLENRYQLIWELTQ